MENQKEDTIEHEMETRAVHGVGKVVSCHMRNGFLCATSLARMFAGVALLRLLSFVLALYNDFPDSGFWSLRWSHCGVFSRCRGCRAFDFCLCASKALNAPCRIP